ncbi:MAG: hypothetical protein J7J44_07480 [Deltaproteobacteria bacterium]|nr:hypothetical protein [Deltaproteobacteria bacterium]
MAKNECELAIKAALEILKEKCGGITEKVSLGGIEIEIPEEIVKIKHSNPMTVQEKIDAIAHSTWARHWAEGLLKFATGRAPTEEEIERLSRRLAEKVVGS